MARGFLEDDKTKITWNLPRELVAKNRVKLLLNMLIIAGQTIPRGGVLTVDPVGQGATMGFRITASGLNARVTQAIPDLLTGARRRRRSTPMPSSRSIPACWPAIAVFRSRSRAEGEAVVVTAS